MSYRNRTNLAHSWGLVDRPRTTAEWAARVICLTLKPERLAIRSQAARESNSPAQDLHHCRALFRTPSNMPGGMQVSV